MGTITDRACWARTQAMATGVAAALTWLGERAYYPAAIGHAPFDDEQALVDVLTDNVRSWGGG